jgi:hypothetical protein
MVPAGQGDYAQKQKDAVIGEDVGLHSYENNGR